MRFLHLDDLHLGKQMKDLSLLADQEAVLQQIISISEAEQVDAVLIAGDVYQRSSPQAEAMALFDDFISNLVAQRKKVCQSANNSKYDYILALEYSSSMRPNSR